jgi:hypothetical protein
MADSENKFTPSKEVATRVEEFVEADAEYAKTWADFEEKAKQWFDLLEGMRDKRNRRLDDAIRALREEAGKIDYHKISSFKLGPFKVDKKMKRFYLPDEFYATAKDLGFLDNLKTIGAIAQKVEIDTEKASKWIKEHELKDKFADTYKEEEMTSAVTGPKEVPPFGAAIKTAAKK